MKDSSVSDSEKQIALRDAETTLARLVENAQEQGNTEALSTAIGAQNEVNSIKQKWESEVTTGGDNNAIGISGRTGKSGEVDQNWKARVGTEGSKNKVGIAGKAGDVGDVEQTWVNDVNTKGNGNSVGIIS